MLDLIIIGLGISAAVFLTLAVNEVRKFNRDLRERHKRISR